MITPTGNEVKGDDKVCYINAGNGTEYDGHRCSKVFGNIVSMFDDDCNGETTDCEPSDHAPNYHV